MQVLTLVPTPTSVQLVVLKCSAYTSFATSTLISHVQSRIIGPSNVWKVESEVRTLNCGCHRCLNSISGRYLQSIRPFFCCFYAAWRRVAALFQNAASWLPLPRKLRYRGFGAHLSDACLGYTMRLHVARDLAVVAAGCQSARVSGHCQRCLAYASYNLL